MSHSKQNIIGYGQRIWARMDVRRRTLITYLAAYFFAISSASRSLSESHSLPSQWRVAGLYAAFFLFLAIEPWLSRRSQRYTHLYLAVQTGITSALLLTSPFRDHYAVLFISLSLQATHAFPSRTGSRWIGVFAFVMAVIVIDGYGWSEGLPVILTYAVACFASSLLVAVTRQAEFARDELQVAHRQLQAYAARAALINEVGQRLSGELELDTLLSEIVTAVHDAFDYHNVMLLLRDADAERLTMQSIAGGYADVFPKGLWIAVGEGMTGYAAASGKTQVSGDVSKDPHYVRKEEEETRSELAVPICGASCRGESGRKIIGVLDIQSDEFDAFDQTDVVAMETLSTQIATAIENARLFAERERRVDEMAVLNQVGRAISSTLRLDELLDLIYHQVGRVMDSTNLYIALYDKDEDWVSFPFYVEGDRVRRDAGGRKADRGLTEYIIRSCQPLLLPNEVESRLQELGIESIGSPAKSCLGVPMIAGNEVLGVITVQSYSTEDVYDEGHLSLLFSIAAQAAISIQNARLYEQGRQELAERVRAQEALRESEDSLKLAMEGANVGFFHLKFGPDETVLVRAWTPGLGAEPVEIESTAEAWFQMEPVHPDDRAKFTEAFDTHVSGKAPFFEVEYRGQTESGEWAWMVQRGQVVARDEHGQPLRIAGMYQDVSERVRAEEALERRAAQLATLNRIGNQVSSILDQEDLLQYVVDAVRDDLGYPRAAVLLADVDEPQVSARLRKSPAESPTEPLDDKQTSELRVATATEDFWDVIPDNYRQPVGKGAIGKAAETGKTILVRDASSDPRVYQVGTWLSPSSLSAPIEVGGRVIGVLEVEADAPDAFDENDVMVMNTLASQVAVAIENVRLYEALRESGETLQLAMEGANVGFWHQNLAIDDQTIIIEDPTQEQGYIEATDETTDQVVHPDDRSRLTAAWDACISGNVPLIDIEYRNRNPSGEWAWILVRGRVVVRDEHGNPVRIAGIYQDVTARVQAQEELREAQAAAEEARLAAENANLAKSVFLANMSHELRTPLNAILGFAQLMTRDTGLTAEQRENLETIDRSGEHLLGLINDVLELSKIEAGRVALHEESFDLHRLLDGLEEMFHLRAMEKGLMLIFDRAPDVPQYVRADEGKLRQVLMNLLGNAVKFTQEGGVTLRVGAVDSGQWSEVGQDVQPTSQYPLTIIRFEVEDTGPGIAPEELDAVFDPFKQTTSGQTSQEGTGLGMPISRQFVRLMGGDLTVRSEFGVGTLFKFGVQIELADAADVPTSQPKRRVMGLEPDQPAYRLLVVEDREANRKLLVKLLEPMGFELREAMNGQEGIEVWERWKPHLIWMDMRMPVMDGYEATQHIKATTQGRDTVIVALTASAFERDRAMILSGGCDDFVRKPFREEEIFDTLAKHLGVRFVYEEGAQPIGVAAEAAEGALTAAALAALPADWVTSLHQAATQLDADLILALLDQMREQHAPLAGALESLVHGFRFDTIMALTQ